MDRETKQALLTAADMQGLSAEFLAVLADAERYRWLRDKAAGEIVFDHTNGQRDGGNRFVLLVPFDGEPIGDNVEQGLRLDASIDAAIGSERDGAA